MVWVCFQCTKLLLELFVCVWISHLQRWKNLNDCVESFVMNIFPFSRTLQTSTLVVVFRLFIMFWMRHFDKCSPSSLLTCSTCVTISLMFSLISYWIQSDIYLWTKWSAIFESSFFIYTHISYILCWPNRENKSHLLCGCHKFCFYYRSNQVTHNSYLHNICIFDEEKQ